MDYTKQGVRNLNTLGPKRTIIPEHLCKKHVPGKPYRGVAYPNSAFDNWETGNIDPGWPAWITECIHCKKVLETHYIFD